MEFNSDAWDPRAYVSIFTAYYGPPPWGCFFCGEPVLGIGRRDGYKGVVHHVDHDRANHHPFNLVAAHPNCHTSYHNGVPLESKRSSPPLSDAHKEAIGWAVRGTKHTEQAKANMAAAAVSRYNNQEERKATGDRFRGVPKRDEHRKKLAEAQKIVSECSGCGNYYNKTWMKRHVCTGGD